MFLEGAELHDRIAAGGGTRIGEIGFGVGLNFCAALTALQAASSATLEYIAFERCPPSAQEIERALSPWPELAAARDALLACWPPKDGAAVKIGDKAALTLHVGEALDRIDRLDAACDVWWLDGFSPAKNPDAWDQALLAKIFERIAPGGRLSTYAAAGWVRRGLAAAGFTVERAPGFGAKREMLKARRPL